MGQGTATGAPAVVSDPVLAPAGTPSPEQTPPPAPEATPPTTPPAPVDVTRLQQAYTQASQLNSVYRKELGLPSTATEADVRNAIARLRAPASSTITDPVVLEALGRARETQWNANRQLYGETADVAKQLREAILTTDDPDEIVQLVHRAVTAQQTQAPAPAASAPPSTPPAGEPEPAAQPPADIPLTFGETIDLGDAKPDIDMEDLRGSGRPEDFFKRLAGKIRLPGAAS